MKKIQTIAANFNFLPNKLNFCCENYSRAETIRGSTVFPLDADVVSWPARKKNLEMTLPDNPVYRFLKLAGIQIAFLLRCIYVRKFLCLMEFGIPSFFKVRSVTPVEVLHPMRSMCYSRCTCTVLRTWVCTVQFYPSVQ